MTPDEVIREATRLANAVIEEAVEEAIQGGVCGVKVSRSKWGWTVIAEVDPSVPYGEIHEHIL
jgi:hypothetical protein